MNLLIVGGGKGGSWQIRGVQMGAALGARVTVAPTRDDARWADRIIVVKRALAAWGAQLRAYSSAPLIWDAVDFWAQPAQNHLTRDEAVAVARAYMRPYAPDLVIGATWAMAEALGGVCVPHHARPGLVAQPVRETVQMVAYEGAPVYLGRWQGVLERLCAARGWAFAVNPPRLTDADILVALRDGQWDGWMCRQWKSGVKVVNAIAAGRPIISQAMAAQAEIQPPGSVIATEAEIDEALTYWADAGRRRDVAAWSQDVGAAPWRLEAIAARYREMLEGVACRA